MLKMKKHWRLQIVDRGSQIVDRKWFRRFTHFNVRCWMFDVHFPSSSSSSDHRPLTSDL